MGCGDEKLSKYLTQTFTAHCNAMICQQVMLSGDAEWPKVADAVIEADHRNGDRRDTRYANLQALHGHCHDAKTREHRDYLPLGMRDQHQDTRVVPE